MTYTVVGSTVSPFVRKVMAAMTEKDLAFEHEDLNPFAPPEGFRDISPLGRIPVLRHDDRIINDSSVICHYVESLHPEPSLYGDDPFQCARIEWIEEYVDGGLVPVAGPKVFAPRVLAPLMGGKEPDEAAIEKVIEEQLPPYFDYLEAQLEDSGHFVGDSLTIADITVASAFVNLRLAGVKPGAKRWPKLSAFVDRMHERASFAKLIEPVRSFLSKHWV
jgi:glutathione S-transferase